MLKSMTFRSTLAAVACAISFSAHAMADSPKKIEIPAGDLRPALLQLSKTFGVELLYQPSQLNHFRTAGVKGSYTPQAAVRLLLEGTPLELRTDPSGAMMVIDPKAPRAAAVSALSEQVAPPPVSSDNSQSRSGLQLAQATPGASSSSASVSGQTSSSQESSKEERGLQEVIVTAQKREERLIDVPISISVLSGPALDRSTFSGVTEALNTVPGVTAAPNYNSGGTYITIRGAAASGPALSGSSPTAYYLDSVPFGFVRSALFPDPDVYDLQRVEVLRGPQGTLYGANAEAGLVRVLTNDADLNNFEVKAQATGSGTEYGGTNYSGDAALNAPIVDGKLAVRAVVDYANLSGWTNNAIDTHVNDAQLRNYRFKVNAEPTEGLYIGLSSWSTHNDNGAPSASNQARFTPAAIPEPIKTDFDAYALKVGYGFPQFSMSSATSYLDYTNSQTTDVAALVPVFPPGTAFFQNLFAHVFSEEVVFNSLADSVWLWSAGAIYRDATDRLTQDFPLIASLTELTDTSRSYAAYGELGRRFFDSKFEWALGLRYFHDDVSDRNNLTDNQQTAPFHATTPRAILTWHPGDNLSTYASYSEGFRSGVLQSTDVVPATVYQTAKPDKLHNYEIGAKGDLFGNRVSFDAAVYYEKWTDVQQLLCYSPLCYALILNGQSASGPGLDLSVTTRPVDGLEIGLTFGWNELKMDAPVIAGGFVVFNKGDRLNYASEFTGGPRADYIFSLGATGLKGRFSASANYSSKQAVHSLGLGIPINYGEDIWIARAAFSVSTPEHWDVTLYADNLNNTYAAGPSNQGDPAQPRPRPRTVGLKLGYHY